MPRRPIVARLRLGELQVDVYDREALLLLLEALRRELPRSSPAIHGENKGHREHKESGGDKGHKRDKGLNTCELPSFAQGNPWLETLAKRTTPKTH